MHGVTVRLEGASTLPAIQADGTQIEQVMLNLMLNGVEAAATNAQTRRARWWSPPRRTTEPSRSRCSDTGGGLAPEVEQRLFTPFVTTKAHGLGLGLAISRSIVESHGGRLWASSRPAPGRTFRFFLPVSGGALAPAAVALSA